MERDSVDFRGMDTSWRTSHTLRFIPHIMARPQVSFTWIACIFNGRTKIEKVDMVFFCYFQSSQLHGESAMVSQEVWMAKFDGTTNVSRDCQKVPRQSDVLFWRWTMDVQAGWWIFKQSRKLFFVPWFQKGRHNCIIYGKSTWIRRNVAWPCKNRCHSCLDKLQFEAKVNISFSIYCFLTLKASTFQCTCSYRPSGQQ